MFARLKHWRYRQWRTCVALLLTVGGGIAWVDNRYFAYTDFWNGMRSSHTWHLLGSDAEDIWDLCEGQYPRRFANMYLERGYIELDITWHSCEAERGHYVDYYVVGLWYHESGAYPSWGNPPYLAGVVVGVQIPYLLALLWITPAVRGLRTMRRRRVHRRREQSSECLECGYSLVGNVSGVCPECGCATKSLGRENCEVSP